MKVRWTFTEFQLSKRDGLPDLHSVGNSIKEKIALTSRKSDTDDVALTPRVRKWSGCEGG